MLLQDEFWSDRLAGMVELIERQERGEGVATGIREKREDWLTDLRQEMEARRLAEAQAQYRRDQIMTRIMFEMSRLQTVELLEEMNRELLEGQGRVEPVYTTRHELCLSWSVTNGRNLIRVGADYDEDNNEIILVVTGAYEQRTVPNEAALKRALIEVFRQPHFDNYRW
jgi:hypothetical protein